MLILSPVYGLVSADEKISYKEPLRIHEVELKLSVNEMNELREASLAKLQEIFAKTRYEQVYVNVGQSLFKAIEGLKRWFPQPPKLFIPEEVA